MASQPKWFKFESSIAFGLHEINDIYSGLFSPNVSGLSDLDHALIALQGCSAMAIQTSAEFEGEYLGLLKKLHQIPVIPIGLLPPTPPEKRETTDPKWAKTLKWLDEQPNRSVVFVYFGSECKLNRDQVFEIAHGLQLSNLPFLWALRRPIWATNDMDTLPLGFESWIASRGVVHMGWVPQLEILAHHAIRSGWGSIIETVQYEHAVIVLPLANIQSLDARHLVDKGLAIQVEINNDGSFHRDAIAWSLRRAVVEEEGENIRRKSMEVRPVFSDQKLHQSFWLRLNIDGSSRGNPGESGGGRVCRDHSGNLVFAFHRYYRIASNTIAEAQAIVDGLNICTNLGVANIVVESDSKLIVEAAEDLTSSTPWKIWYTMGEIRFKKWSLNLSFSHIFREGNSVADALARLASDGCPDRIYRSRSSLPRLVRGELVLDNAGLGTVRSP